MAHGFLRYLQFIHHYLGLSTEILQITIHFGEIMDDCWQVRPMKKRTVLVKITITVWPSVSIQIINLNEIRWQVGEVSADPIRWFRLIWIMWSQDKLNGCRSSENLFKWINSNWLSLEECLFWKITTDFQIHFSIHVWWIKA